MTRRRLLTEEQGEQIYQDYCLWLSLAPQKLCEKYGIARETLRWYAHRKHKTKLSICDPPRRRKVA